MQKSEQHQSSIAEEEHINIVSLRKKQQPINPYKLKYALVNQIKSFERVSQIYNQKLIQTRPLLFSQQSLSNVVPIHFLSSSKEQSLMIGGKKQETKDILEVQQDKITLKLAVSNIRRENRLILVIKNLKKRAVVQLKAMLTNNEGNAVKFKYAMNLNDINLLLRVMVELQGEQKVWKEVEVPLVENKFTIEINEYNNEQTDIKINEFLFHLLLKMPYQQNINYCLLHKGNAEVEKVQFLSRRQKKQIQSKQTYCSNKCQLI